MIRFSSLIVDNKKYTFSLDIERYLVTTEYNWLLECEVENVNIEIKDNILIWKSGIFYWGTWYWGIWKSGEFRSGIWNGGVFYDGIFNGDWLKGRRLGGEFKSVDIEIGEII